MALIKCPVCKNKLRIENYDEDEKICKELICKNCSSILLFKGIDDINVKRSKYKYLEIVALDKEKFKYNYKMEIDLNSNFITVGGNLIDIGVKDITNEIYNYDLTNSLTVSNEENLLFKRLHNFYGKNESKEFLMTDKLEEDNVFKSTHIYYFKVKFTGLEELYSLHFYNGNIILKLEYDDSEDIRDIIKEFMS